MEKLIHHSLYTLLESSQVLHHSQFGFRHKHSTTLLLATVVDDWARSLDSHQSVHSIFIDFAKAFDSVPHKRLLCKLEAYGVSGTLLNWFKAFLCDRRQRVVINGTASDWAPVLSGVPQGSILGPLLFILYINDLPNNLQCNIKMFADDVAVYKSIVTREDCDMLQHDLSSISLWCQDWQMNLQPPKCEALCISNKKNLIYYNYHLCNNSLSWCTSTRYLGVIIDSKLNWNSHCDFITAKSFRVLGVLKRYMSNCSMLSKKRALILPILEYAIPSWSAYTKRNINCIELVQSKGARWVCGSKYVPSLHTWTVSSAKCCDQLHWCPLSVRRQYLGLLFLFKIIHCMIDVKFDEYFVFSDSRTRSHRLSIRCKSSCVSSYRNSFFVNIIFFGIGLLTLY